MSSVDAHGAENDIQIDASTFEITSHGAGMPPNVGAPPSSVSRDNYNAPIGGSNIGGTNSHNVVNNNNSNNYHYYTSPSPDSITVQGQTVTVPRPVVDSILPTEIGQDESASEAYARILLTKKIGYPLWIPEPLNNHPEYQREGISIGDVGTITFDGGFDFLFNICLPADHPVNRQAPPAFEPLTLNHDEDTRTRLIYHHGGVISSKSIVKRLLVSDVDPPANEPSPSPLHFRFTCLSTEGALLILPDGAIRKNLRFRDKFRKYAQQHILRWYEHVYGTLGLEVEAGPLYLVTGADKCYNWCLGSYSNFSREMSLGFTPTNVTLGNTTRSYTWESSGPVDARTCFEPGQEVNQCVFIRGYKMSLCKSLLERILLGPVKISDIIPPNPSNVTEGGRISGSTALGGWFSSLGGNRGGSQPRDAEPGITSNTVIESVPEQSAPYHPSNIINSSLLDANPDAQVAITHDDEWCAVMEEEDSMPNEPELLRRIIERYEPVREAGCIFLVPKDETDSESLSMALEGMNREANEVMVNPPFDMSTDIVSKGKTPLHRAAFTGNEVAFRLLVESGADINARDDMGMTPLHWAAKRANKTMLKLLFEKGADDSGWDITELVSSGDEILPTISGHSSIKAAKAQQKIPNSLMLHKRVDEIHSEMQTNIQQCRAPPSSGFFTGRGEYLEILRSYFGSFDQSQLRKVFLLFGLGGIGKTQICLKFAEESSDWFCKIFWIDASNSETIKLSLHYVADDPEAQASGVETSTESVLRWISGISNEWLLVFDNAHDPNMLALYMPPGNRGNVLITSRNPDMQGITAAGACAEVDHMDEDDAISLLLKVAFLDQHSSDLRQLSRPIVTEFCCLPLAIDQAGTTIASGLCNLESFLRMYPKHCINLLDSPSFETALHYGRSVHETWDLSLATIERRATGRDDSKDSQVAETAILILQTFAFLHCENITEEIFQRAAEVPQKMVDCGDIDWTGHLPQTTSDIPLRLLQLDNDGKWDANFFREGIRVLLSFSLVKRGASGNSYAVHPLVHSWSRARMSQSERNMKYHSVKLLLSRSITFQFATEDYTFRRSLIPHIRAINHHAVEGGIVQPYKDDYYDEFNNFGLVFYENGYWKEAKELGVQVMEKRKRVLGLEHPETLTSMNNLALTYQGQGQWKEAEELEIMVMESRKRILGVEHPDTLTIMSNLALTFLDQGRFKEAEELEVQVIELRKSVLGAEHPDTLTSLANLASIYWSQRRLREAEELELRVMEKRRNILGVEHPDTLTIMSNLALTFWDQERLKEAEELEVQVMEVRRRVLGEEHPDMLTSIANLASIYRSQGRLAAAEELGVQVMETRKKTLGVQHPDMLTSMANLASIFWSQGRLTEAEELELRVMETRRSVLGREHPDTLTIMSNLASTFWDQGRSREAEELEVQAMEIRKRILGANYPETLASMANLALKYRSRGQLTVRDLKARVRRQWSLETDTDTEQLQTKDPWSDHPLRNTVNLA